MLLSLDVAETAEQHKINMSPTVTTPEIPLPDTLSVEKNGIQLTIPWRKKKSGDNAGSPVPFLDKNITLEDVIKAFSPEFVLRCALTRANTALSDWHDDVIEKKGMFVLEEFVRRVQEGRVVRLSMAEINEEMEALGEKLDKLLIEIDANGGINTPEGMTANVGRVLELKKLIAEQQRLAAQKNANKRPRKSDDDNE